MPKVKVFYLYWIQMIFKTLTSKARILKFAKQHNLQVFLLTIILYLSLFSSSFGKMDIVWSTSHYYDQIFTIVGKEFKINPYFLKAIAVVESKLNWKAINRNKNGSYDLGLMQINSSHIGTLVSKGIIPTAQHIWHPYYNVRAGAYILLECLYSHGYSWKAVDCYNKGNKARSNSQYVWKVYLTYNQIVMKNNDGQNKTYF